MNTERVQSIDSSLVASSRSEEEFLFTSGSIIPMGPFRFLDLPVDLKLGLLKCVPLLPEDPITHRLRQTPVLSPLNKLLLAFDGINFGISHIVRCYQCNIVRALKKVEIHAKFDYPEGAWGSGSHQDYIDDAAWVCQELRRCEYWLLRLENKDPKQAACMFLNMVPFLGESNQVIDFDLWVGLKSFLDRSWAKSLRQAAHDHHRTACDKGLLFLRLYNTTWTESPVDTMGF